MEHRWGRRIGVNIPVQICAPDARLVRRAYLANLSITGALVQAEFRLRTRSRIRIVVLDSAVPRHIVALSVEAFVTHDHLHGIGVEWCDLAPAAVRDLLRAVTTRADITATDLGDRPLQAPLESRS